jgi:anaphase-promoting complex subunit 2
MSTLMSLLDRYDPLLFGLIYEEIEKRVHQDCAGQFDGPKLEALGAWLNGPVMGWVSGIYAKSVEGGQEEAKKMLKPTFSRFEYHVHKTLCLLRTTEMFDMIVDYPDSKPALDDLKVRSSSRSITLGR